MTKVIHVHLIFEKKDYYFGSISAIYTVLNDAQIGIKQSSLLHAGLTDGGVKITRRAIIRQSHLIRCIQGQFPLPHTEIGLNCASKSVNSARSLFRCNIYCLEITYIPFKCYTHVRQMSQIVLLLPTRIKYRQSLYSSAFHCIFTHPRVTYKVICPPYREFNQTELFLTTL